MNFTLDQFLGTVTGRAVVKEARATELAKRRQLTAELEDHTARKPALTAKHRKTLEPLERAVEAARSRFVTAEGERKKATAATFAEVHALDVRIAHLESQLRATADPAIAAARARMERDFEHARHTAGRHEERVSPDGARDPETLKPVIIRIGNERAFARLISTLREARAQFAALELAAPEDVAAEIELIERRVADAYAHLGDLDPVPVATGRR